jgi:RNA polymerase sigma-70 factor (ECF subfamily)
MSDTTLPESPDLARLNRAKAGDSDAFADIYRQYQHVVYRFGCAMTGSESAAEDITQETFVAVFRDLARYDPDRASFTTYLYGIVRNMSRERLRRDRRFLPLDLLGPRRERAGHASDPANILECAERVTQVRRALLKLPSRYREVIILCDLHAMSYADAAAVAGISTAAVRSRLHRGRQLLRRQLSRLAGPAPRGAINTERCAI